MRESEYPGHDVYASHVCKAQRLINDTEIAMMYQDKKFLELLERFAIAAGELKAASIHLASRAMLNLNLHPTDQNVSSGRQSEEQKDASSRPACMVCKDSEQDHGKGNSKDPQT